MILKIILSSIKSNNKMMLGQVRYWTLLYIPIMMTMKRMSISILVCSNNKQQSLLQKVLLAPLVTLVDSLCSEVKNKDRKTSNLS